jgi:hypothetical protein
MNENYLSGTSNPHELNRWRGFAAGEGGGIIVAVILNWQDVIPESELSFLITIAFFLAVVVNFILFLWGIHVWGLIVGSVLTVGALYYVLWGVGEYLTRQESSTGDVIFWLILGLITLFYLSELIKNGVAFFKMNQIKAGCFYLTCGVVFGVISFLPIKHFL